jgi:hypothetical protein
MKVLNIVTVLKRDLYARAILVECPRCGLPLALRPFVITNLEEGINTMGPCEYCGETLAMMVAALGGEIWPVAE